MFKRFKRYIKYKFICYIPGTSKLAVMEAKRLSQHIFDNWDSHQQLIILDEIKNNLIEMKENQIKNQEIELLQKESNLKYLKSNFDKLQTK